MLQYFRFTCEQCQSTKSLLLEEKKVEQWRQGALVQTVFPELPKEDRELMISKTCGPCFERLFRSFPDLSK